MSRLGPNENCQLFDGDPAIPGMESPGLSAAHVISRLCTPQSALVCNVYTAISIFVKVICPPDGLQQRILRLRPAGTRWDAAAAGGGNGAARGAAR
jgi:hypothetical protein